MRLADLGEAQQHPAIGLVAGDAEPQIGLGDFDRLARTLFGEGVGDLLLIDEKARGVRAAVVAGSIFHRSRLVRRDGELDRHVARIGRNVERWRWRQIAGNREGQPVGQDTDQPLHRELAQRGKILVDPQLDQAPGIGSRSARPRRYQRIDMTVLLLEMLLAEEESFTPRHP